MDDNSLQSYYRLTWRDIAMEVVRMTIGAVLEKGTFSLEYKGIHISYNTK